MGKLKVIEVAQVDRGVRYVALAEGDARRVKRDRALLDTVDAEAVLDVDRNGRRTWERPFRCVDSPEGRAAIREHLAR